MTHLSVVWDVAYCIFSQAPTQSGTLFEVPHSNLFWCRDGLNIFSLSNTVCSYIKF